MPSEDVAVAFTPGPAQLAKSDEEPIDCRSTPVAQAEETPVVLALHPRTRDRLPALKDVARHGALHFTKPLGYLDSLTAIRHANGVVTDSGGVQREAYLPGVPCLTLRRETEWTETIALGANRLVDPHRAAADLARAVDRMLVAPARWDRDEYGTGQAAAEIVAGMDMAMVGNA
jgi:UDP-N-acetylglucosamine 2-epimerase